ncbi:S49 family peptidase [Blastochloris viridis]|nr:S49 family peptidase [Blastochloris viridis]
MAASLSERLIYRIRPLLPASLRPPEMPVVPVVRLTGVIGFSTPLSPGMTMASVARVLERAFAVRDAKAVALIINSPGGSAVQSHLIHRRIRLLAEEAKLPVLVFVEDVAASGGYMIACAGDEIFADPSSIVGSIGVIGASFGFDKLIEKIGVERRVYTAGTRKSMLDPFRPEDPEDVERVKTIQRAIHAKFIELVKGRRGARLAAPDDSLFTGEYWEAERAKAFGLIDDIGETRTVLRQRFGDKVLMPLISAERTLFGRRLPGFGQAAEVGPGLAADVVSAIEARALWSRYGL